MIREKYKWYISIISMGLAVVLSTGAMLSYNSNSINKVVTSNIVDTVLDSENVTDINIDIDESDWNWLIENATNEEFRSCNITINGETYYNVGIRPKGNTSLTNVASDDTTDRYSFKIKFDEYVDNQTYKGMESIVLNNMIQDSTYIKEYITYDLYSSLGVATPEMSYSNVKVNNETWGFYLALEVIDERYLESNFGTSEGNLYKPETMGVNGGNKGGENKGAGGNPPDMNGENPMGGRHHMENQNNQEGANAPADMKAPEQQGQEMPQMQGGEVQGNMPPDVQNNAAEGNMPPDAQGNMQQDGQNGEAQQTAPTDMPNGFGNMGGMPGNGRASEGADFIYIDDEVSSYSIVRDSAVLKSTTDEDFKNVINMYKNLNEGTNLEEVLDVEEVLKYFAVNTFVINLDSYSGGMYHNYYLYEKDGKCQILPWDLNLSFGGFGANHGMNHGGNATATSNTGSEINFPIDNPVSGTLENMPLIGKLLEVDEYKEMYHGYLNQIAEEYFNSGYYENLVNKLDNLISDYVKEDPTAFCTYDEYKTAVSEMINFGKDRTTSVLAQLSGEQPSTTYGNIESTVNISAMGDMGGGMAKGNKGEAPMEHDMQNGENKDVIVGGAPQNPVENTPDNDNMNAQVNPSNEDKNIQADMMNNKIQHNNHDGGMHPDNMMQNNTKNYLVLGALTLFSILGVIFASKFKRKGKI